MTDEQAKAVLEAMGARFHHNYISGESEYFCVAVGEESACLDGNFTAEQLEAIAHWMRANAKPEERANCDYWVFGAGAGGSGYAPCGVCERCLTAHG